MNIQDIIMLEDSEILNNLSLIDFTKCTADRVKNNTYSLPKTDELLEEIVRATSLKTGTTYLAKTKNRDHDIVKILSVHHNKIYVLSVVDKKKVYCRLQDINFNTVYLSDIHRFIMRHKEVYRHCILVDKLTGDLVIHTLQTNFDKGIKTIKLINSDGRFIERMETDLIKFIHSKAR